MSVPKALSEAGLLSTAEIAAQLNVHRSTVWIWIKQGLLKSQRVGPSKNWIGVSQKQLDDFTAMYPIQVSNAHVSKMVTEKRKKVAKAKTSQPRGKASKRKEGSK